ncbi:MAG TPA: hypothetical protein GX498_08640 [Clostridiales bacterium]|nr:hypothetical protein [Clostridiales bacterium]
MKLSKWVIAILIVSLLLNIKATLDIGSMKNEIRNLNSKVNSLNHSLIDTVSNTINDIERTLEKEASMVNGFEYENIGIKDKKADYILSVNPKVYNKGEKIYFQIKTGKDNPQLIPAETEDNINFKATTSISIFDKADIDLVIEGENHKRTEKLDTIPSLAYKYAARINVRLLASSIRRNIGSSKRVFTYEYELINDSKPGEGTSIKEANLHIELNGKEIGTFPMKLEDTTKFERFHVLVNDYELQCNAGDEITMYIIAKDNMGLNYKCYLEEWVVKEDDITDHSSKRYRFGEVEVY